MLFLRSAVFNAAFYLNLIVWMLIALPVLLLPRQAFFAVVRIWTGITLWLLRTICGIGMEIRGREHLPSGGYLVACKHQSIWETFSLFVLLRDPTFIIKRELQWIPLYGWMTIKAGCVPINRKGGSQALIAMNRRALAEAATGRQIVIFPEGTRRPAGAPPAYKYGIAHIYEQTGLRCLPIGLNSGVFWPRRSFLRHPGTIVVEILPVIEAGLPRDDFFQRMQAAIETSSARLLAEATTR